MRRRSSQTEVARRLNRAQELLQGQAAARRVLTHLMARDGLSRRQAYRYLRLARQVEAPVPVPEAQEAFCVRLPRRLIAQVRGQAHREGCVLKAWVGQALQRALPPEADCG